MSWFHQPKPATIASGQTVGAIVDLRGQRLVSIQTPATLTGTTLTWQVAPTSTGTFDAAYHLGALLALTATVITSVAAGRHIALPFDKAPANCFLKLVSGSAEGADRTFYLFTESV